MCVAFKYFTEWRITVFKGFTVHTAIVSTDVLRMRFRQTLVVHLYTADAE